MPNLVEIGQNAALIWRSFDFSRWRPPPSWIFQISNFYGRTAEEGRTASLCQIWSKSVKTRPSYGDFSILQDGAAAILDFLNFKFLTVGRLKRPNCVAMPNLVEIGQNAAELWRIFDFSRWRPPPSWIFQISNF